MVLQKRPQVPTDDLVILSEQKTDPPPSLFSGQPSEEGVVGRVARQPGGKTVKCSR